MNAEIKKLTLSEIQSRKTSLREGWEVVENQKIRRIFEFADFKRAIDFTNKVADLAEAADHHPDIGIFYRKVTIELSTHSARGLTEKDFDLAEKVDALVS